MWTAKRCQVRRLSLDWWFSLLANLIKTKLVERQQPRDDASNSPVECQWIFQIPIECGSARDREIRLESGGQLQML